MKKQFLRVKQIADQTFLRAEKTDVLTEDLVTAEKRVDTIRVSCQTTQKKISSCNIDFGSENSAEKRLRKIPQIALGSSMLENGSNFSKNSILGDTLRECSTVQTRLGNELLDYNNEVEKTVLKPISSVLENDVHNISKLRKQLGKLVLDMDSARTRFHTAERHSMQTSSNASLNTMGKVDSLKDELEDASQKVEQCRDALATEMFTLISKEPHLAQLFVHLHELQADYHRNALAILESSLPVLQEQISNFPQKPVYGCSLEEHLRVTNRDIALVIETCVSFLMEYGIVEEGLLRIAGSASKLKKLKSAFDAGYEIDMTEFVRDPHAVSGALKSYLRELPEPLMTFSLYDEWIDAAKVQDFDAKLQALWQVLHKLPDANFRNLQYVIKFLSKLYENADVNKMSSQNIAIVMAPNLIWPASEDSSATFGMNMSTASLHTSVVDMLISYADWFFPDEVLFTPKVSNLNDGNACEVTSEPVNSDNEINGNNLQITSGPKDGNPSSPRIQQRNIKKPAAPPPPAQRSINCDKNTSDEVIPTGELINFSVDTLDSVMKSCDTVLMKNDTFCYVPKDKVEKNIVTSLVRRKSNENFNNSELISKTDRPVIPEKPVSYSSASLDRRNHRQSCMSRGDRMPDCMVRSHIERPTVPPPERPAKPPKFCSSENISTNLRKSSGDEDSVQPSTKSGPISPDKPSLEGNQIDTNTVPISNTKADRSPPSLQHSRSLTKVNRFDFLVNQSNDKPPERPPRSTVDHPEKTAAIPETAEADSSQNVPTTSSVKASSFPSVEGTSPPLAPPPISPRASDVEKVKPPRPQPPLPAKPKFNMANENTSL